VTIKVTVRRIGEVSVIDAVGRLTLGEGTNAVRDTVRDLIANGNSKLVLNLAGITHMDSAGIGELVTGFTTAAGSGGRLKLLGLTKKVRELLQITKLYAVFEVFEDEAAAVRSFG
jgi:anti-sigma B factor antagonist